MATIYISGLPLNVTVKQVLPLMFPIVALGQYTSIPDSIFEQKLIDLGHDTTHDGQVFTANIINIDSLTIKKVHGSNLKFEIS